MKKILFLCMLTLLGIRSTLGQSYMPKTNFIDSNNQRIGVWNLTNGYTDFQTIYIDGARNGCCKEMDKNGYLRTVGQYTYNFASGNWYHFDESGRIEYKIDDFVISNQFLFDTSKQAIVAPKFKCTYMEYYPTGQLRKEGDLLFEVGDFPLSKNSRPYGIWKWYTPDGKLDNVVCFLFSWLYSMPANCAWTMACDYKWALSDEPILLPYIE